MTQRAGLDRLAQERVELARELLAVFDAAAQPILGDLAVWAEEARRDGAAPLPWPQPLRGEGYPQLLRILFATTVDSALQAIEQQHGLQWVPREDPAEDDFQWVLRVAKRATDAGDLALSRRFGGAGLLSIKRELLKMARERQAEAALRSGQRRAAAFGDVGLSKPGAYRALRRLRTR